MKRATPGKTPRIVNEVAMLREEVEELRKKVAEAQSEVAAAKAQAEVWERAHAALATRGTGGTAPASSSEATVWSKVMGFTTKQHCAMQMLLAAQGNREIAERMGVQESTAKVYLRAMFGKLGVHTRAEFALTVKPVFDKIPAAEYERAAGIPKTWHQNWTPSDPFKERYYGDRRGR